MRKKYVLGIVIICICAIISACTGYDNLDGNNDKLQIATPSISDATTTTTGSVLEDPPTPESEELSGGEEPLLIIESYDEYLKFIKGVNLPTDFVSYEAISTLGEFKSFVCLSDASNNDFSSCMYNLFDESQSEFVLYVDIGSQTAITTPVSTVTTIDGNNMRSLVNSSGAGIYVASGMEYKYVAGKLLSISWSNDNVSYTLSGTSMLGDYPEDFATTAVGKMMNIQSATSVVAAVIDDATVS